MNFIAAIKHGLEAIKMGKSLRNVESWKNAQGVSSFLVVIVALVRACGVDFGIDDSALAAAGVAIAALANAYLTYATTKKVGLPAETPARIEPVEAPVQATIVNPPSPVERRTAYHGIVRNPAMLPGTVGAIRERHGERLSDGPTDGVERRGVSDMEYPSARPNPPFVARADEAGWNDR